MDNSQNTGVPGGVITATLVCGLAGLGYGVLSAMVPFLIVQVLLILFAALICTLIFQNSAGPRLVKLVFALLGAGVAVYGTWLGWLWWEMGWTGASQIALVEPMSLVKNLTQLSERMSFSMSRRGTSTEIGPGMVQALWALTSGLMALAPIYGALSGPRRGGPNIV